jgi:hypothetical protein
VNPATPLEACGHTRISASSEVAAYLDRLAAASDEADCQTLGYSVRGTPLRALIIRRAGATRRRLRLMHERRDDILAEVARAREAAPRENIQLYAGYVLDRAHPTVRIPMRRLDTRELEDIEFRDHRKVETADEIAMPSTLLVVDHQQAIAGLLDKHRIAYEALEQPTKVNVLASRFEAQANITERVKVLASDAREITAPAGTLAIDTAQANGRVAVLLLDPRSTSSVFRYPEYAAMVTRERDHFVYPVFKGVARSP